MSDYSIPSSGDYEKDQLELERIRMSDSLIRVGQCPNGCGKMRVIDAYNSTCDVCELFCYFNSAGFEGAD